MTIRFLILFSFLIPFKSFSQTKYKHLADINFKIGDKIIAPSILFNLSGDSWFFQPFIDSVGQIAEFLKKHPKLKIELGGHTDSRGKKESNLKLSYIRTKYIKDYLVKIKGIDSTIIKVKGYGASSPIITENFIKSSKTNEEKEKLHAINRRTEIKILSTE